MTIDQLIRGLEIFAPAAGVIPGFGEELGAAAEAASRICRVIKVKLPSHACVSYLLKSGIK
jgi:hypothetical protein